MHKQASLKNASAKTPKTLTTKITQLKNINNRLPPSASFIKTVEKHLLEGGTPQGGTGQSKEEEIWINKEIALCPMENRTHTAAACTCTDVYAHRFKFYVTL